VHLNFIHEAIAGHNGFALIPNLDTLFDSVLISFIDGKIFVSENLSEQEIKISKSIYEK
jgi:hypothetical protein